MSFESVAGLRRIKITWRFALLKPHFESKIYTRAVDLKRYPCLHGDLSSHRIVFTIAVIKSRNFASV